MTALRHLAIAAACAVLLMASPAQAQQSTAAGEYCAAAPTSFTCEQETCFTACMTPDEWRLCETKTWYADSYDRRFTAPHGATRKNGVRFYERCGTVCRPMGSPRMAYRTKGGMSRDGNVIEPRWVVFPFSPPRER